MTGGAPDAHKPAEAVENADAPAPEATGGAPNTPETPEAPPKPTLRGYKAVCAKLGLSMCVYFICRLLTGSIAELIAKGALNHDMNLTLYAVLHYAMVVTMTYIIPLAFTVIIFKYRTPARPAMRELYKKPRKVVRALGTFPAAYGFGYGVALLTLLVSLLLSNFTGGDTYVEELLRPATVQETSNVAELVMMMIMLVVIAPLFEEFWTRGIYFDALRPYGAGMAIIISAVLFGLMHGSLYMLFYTIAFGLALGYLRYATGSLFITTILHAMVNAVSATTLLILSLGRLTGGQNRILNTIDMIYIVVVLVLIIAGICVFIAKIPTIRKYRFDNPWKEFSGWKKIGIFFISIPVIIMTVLAFNEISGQWLLGLIEK